MSSPNATPAHSAAAHIGRGRRAELKTKVADSTLVQALIAGALSFTHIRDVAMMGGQPVVAAWAYPFIVDLITMSAYRKLKHNQAAGEQTGVPWTCLIVGTAFSIAANIIDAIAHAPAHASPARLTLCVIIGVWPAIAFFGSMILRHSGKPTEQPLPAVQPTTAEPTGQPATQPIARPAAPTVQQRPTDQAPITTPPPIPVQPATRPTGQPDPWTHLGPRAASTGEIQQTAWVEIGRPIYQRVKASTGARPTEAEFHQALGDYVTALIGAGKLPPAVGRPSVSTAKRIRGAIETAHPELTARIVKPPRQLAAATS